VAKRKLLIQPFCKVKPQSFKKFRFQRHCKRSISAELKKAILQKKKIIAEYAPTKQNKQLDYIPGLSLCT